MTLLFFKFFWRLSTWVAFFPCFHCTCNTEVLWGARKEVVRKFQNHSMLNHAFSVQAPASLHPIVTCKSPFSPTWTVKFCWLSCLLSCLLEDFLFILMWKGINLTHSSEVSWFYLILAETSVGIYFSGLAWANILVLKYGGGGYKSSTTRVGVTCRLSGEPLHGNKEAL